METHNKKAWTHFLVEAHHQQTSVFVWCWDWEVGGFRALSPILVPGVRVCLSLDTPMVRWSARAWHTCNKVHGLVGELVGEQEHGR